MGLGIAGVCLVGPFLIAAAADALNNIDFDLDFDQRGDDLPDGTPTYIGPKGGRYYISDTGRKIYVGRTNG